MSGDVLIREKRGRGSTEFRILCSYSVDYVQEEQESSSLADRDSVTRDITLHTSQVRVLPTLASQFRHEIHNTVL